MKPLAVPAHVTIVIPCLNEARTIAACVTRAREALEVISNRFKLSGEVVVADNGSTDGSRDLAIRTGARVVEVAERGYGAALIAGMQAARGKYLVMGDADLSYDFVESVDLVEKLVDGADLCMGNRFAGGIAPGAMPWKNRYIGNPVLSGILRILFGTRVRDAHCGLRALTRNCFDRLRLSSTGMEFASEMVIKAAVLGERIDEVPVTLSPDQRGRAPHLRPYRDGWRHLRFMLMLSPVWLFFVPAAFFAAFGLAIIGALIGGLEHVMVHVGPLAFGDHWMVAASAAVIIAFQLGFFGLAAMIYAGNEGWRPPSAMLARHPALTQLECWMIAGALLGLAGLTIIGIVVARWAGSDFGALNAIREFSTGFTLLVLGIQAFFGGFLLSIINGARAKFVDENGGNRHSSIMADGTT
ncbi:MAG: glycosyltransferase family 2 protein [Dongiaceae bacterium]